MGWHRVLAVVPVVGAIACGGTTRTGQATSGGETGGSGGEANHGGTGGRPFGIGGSAINVASGGFDAAGGFGGAGCEGVCAGMAFPVEAGLVSLLLLLDQSTSMGDPRPGGVGTSWGVVRLAFPKFAPGGLDEGNSVGVQYFPLEGDATTSCTAPYSTPEVALGGKDASDRLIASVNAHQPVPGSDKPTGPALAGALVHMKSWARQHSGTSAAVVLVTDGVATTCEPRTGADLADLARAAFETEPSVRTFVISLAPGATAPDLDAIAVAGGTGKALAVDATQPLPSLLGALVTVQREPVGCTIRLPAPRDGQPRLDPELLDLRYTPSATGITVHVLKVKDAGDCRAFGGQGWYFDSQPATTAMRLCPDSCITLSAGVLEVVSGCIPVGCIPK